MKSRKKPQTIDEFIANYPEDIQEKLQRLRSAIRKAAPQATEIISYGIPAYRFHGNLIYFSAYEHHIGVYPRVKSLEKELAPYEGGKGTIRFPHEKPIPLTLIKKLVKARIEANLQREAVRGLASPKGKTKGKK